MKTFNIFYSWQLDTNPKANKYFINSCLEKAIKEIKSDKTINLIPRLDKDTDAKTGSPDIVESILNKIDACNVFVSDITIINFDRTSKLLRRKFTPNPNVMFELGYALNRLSWDRIICLNNSAISDISFMPFDLRKNRISQFYCDNPKSKEQSNELTQLLVKAIKAIITEYDLIISKEKQGNYSVHDKSIFESFNSIVPESLFKATFENISISLEIEEREFKLIRDIEAFFETTTNHFLINELQISAESFLKIISETRTTFARYSGLEFEEHYDEETKETVKRTYYVLLPERKDFGKYAEYDTEKIRRVKEIGQAIENALQAYKLFRISIKRHLFV